MEKMVNFRDVYSKQFLTLIRMHLSLELDINIEENVPMIERRKSKRWSLSSFSKRISSSGFPTRPKSIDSWTQSNSNIILTDDTISQTKLLMEHLSQDDCMNEEGIFRISGSMTRQKELRILLRQDRPLDLDDGVYSVHDCATVLKGLFAELPEPLLTEIHYPIYCRIAELRNSNSSFTDSKLLHLLQLILLLLPSINRTILKDLLNLLNKVASLENINKMSYGNLAKVFTPHLICSKKITPTEQVINLKSIIELVAFMIKNESKLFEIPGKLVTDIGDKWKLLSPNENIDETILPDTTLTVSSFIDPKSTVKRSGQGMNKKFEKEDTSSHVNGKVILIFRRKSLGYLIKKHIFQKKNIEGSTPTVMEKTREPPSQISFSKAESTPKITKAMQKILMIPRLRKAVAIAPSSNLCNLSSIEDDCLTTPSTPFSECLSSCSVSIPSSSDLSFLSCTSDFIYDKAILSRKRGTSLQRNDSKKSCTTMII